MKKKIVLRVFLVLVLILIGWTAWGFYAVPTQRASRDFPLETPKYDLGKVLVVYYSLSGDTAEVARRIRDMTNGTLHEIETEKSYPSGPALYFLAGLELKNSNFPALKNSDINFSSYDVIFVGSPVWWYTISTPMLSFLSRADFKGKTVVPFSTAGSNFGDFFVRFTSDAKNANIAEGINFSSVKKIDVSVLDQQLSTWLEKLKTSQPPMM